MHGELLAQTTTICIWGPTNKCGDIRLARASNQRAELFPTTDGHEHVKQAKLPHLSYTWLEDETVPDKLPHHS